MDPVLIAAILSLAGIVINTFGPSVVRVSTAMLAGKDPVAAVAAEDVGTILSETSRLDQAMIDAHVKAGHEAALKLRGLVSLHNFFDQDANVISSRDLTVVATAIQIHDLMVEGATA